MKLEINVIASNDEIQNGSAMEVLEKVRYEIEGILYPEPDVTEYQLVEAMENAD